MARFLLSPRAQSDIDDIWDYSAERWGQVQADLYVRELGLAAAAVADDPGKGRLCEEIRPGLRRYDVGSHVLFYRVADQTITVARVLHRRMDFNRHL